MAVSECRLLKGSVAMAAQMTLAATILGTLLYKRQRERPKRPFVVWFMDVSKQAVCATTCHVINMMFAILAYHTVSSEDESGDASECSWYFVQYNFDNVIGVPLTMLIHTGFIAAAKAYSERQPFKHTFEETNNASFIDIIASCGTYGTPPKASWWAIQMLEWIVAVIAARSVCGCFVVLLSSVALSHMAVFVDGIFSGCPVLQLYFVIVVYPLALSTTVAWILDGMLKKSNSTGLESELTEHLIDVEEDERLQ